MRLVAFSFVVESPLSSSKKSEPEKMLAIKRVEPDFDPISAALRQMHDGVASEPVPDEFLKLLDQLEERLADGDEQKP